MIVLAQLVLILAQLAITFSVICIESSSQSKIARITNAFLFYLSPLFLSRKIIAQILVKNALSLF
ncbi:putative membrane protein [Helicobacter pylori Hp H-19]|nr:putative membrane protein [Helicobacter pylori Hp H-19]